MLTENQIKKLLQEPPKEVYCYYMKAQPRFEGDLNAGNDIITFDEEQLARSEADTLHCALSVIFVNLCYEEEDNYLAQKKKALNELNMGFSLHYEYITSYVPSYNYIAEDEELYCFEIGSDKCGWVFIWVSFVGEQSENEYTPHLS